jgi:hypothetical protein
MTTAHTAEPTMDLHASTVKLLKRARTKLRRQRATVPCTVSCSRCGGAGGSEAWRHTGWTCYQCGGRGKWPGTRRDYRPEDVHLRDQDEAISAIIRHLTVESRFLTWRAGREAREAKRRFLALWDEAIAEDEARSRRPVPTGRVEVEGEIISDRSEPGYTYGSTVHKMLVDGGGWRVWGTVPRTLYDGEPIRGRRVRFTATIERSRNDINFGFFKRPTKAIFIGEVA